MTLGLWIDPSDDTVVTREGSPETDAVQAIADKSGLGNDVAASLAPVMVANFEGLDAATSYTSETGQAASFFGTAQLDDAQKKFDGTTLLLDGNSDYVTFADSDDWHLAANDFTIEVWVRFATNPSGQQDGFVSNYDSSITQQGWIFDYNSTGLRFYSSPNGDGTGQVDFTVTWSPSIDTWYHCTITRSGNTVRFFVDGVQVGANQTLSITIHNSTAPLYVGVVRGFSALTGYFDGHIGGLKIINGAALYTGDFEPPLGPFGTGALLEGQNLSSPDTSFALDMGDDLSRPNVAPQLLANFDGADAEAGGSPEYLTDTGQVVTFFASAQLDTAQKRYGTASLLLDGTGDYASIPQSTDFDFGDGDFTIECWARWSSDPGVTPETLVAKWDASGGLNRSWTVTLNNNLLRLNYSTNGAGNSTFYDSTATFNPVADQWYHIVAQRENGTLYYFVDGEVLGSPIAATAAFHAATAAVFFGAIHDGAITQEFTGWLDGVRIVKGVALFSGSFTPPSGPRNLTNFDSMDGPNFTVVVAHTHDQTSPETPPPRGNLISLSGPASPLDETGWRMRMKEDSALVTMSVGDEDTNILNLNPDPAALLATFNGEDAATAYNTEDVFRRVATFGGNAQLDTSQFKFGKSSVILDGTGDYVSFPDTADQNLPNGDWSFEFWVRFNGDPGTGSHQFLTKWTGTNNGSWSTSITTNLMRFAYSTTGADTVLGYDQSWNPAGDTWYHVCYERYNGNLYHYVDGVQLGTEIALTVAPRVGTAPFRVGTVDIGGADLQHLNGWVDNVRVTTDRAVYKGVGFTPADIDLSFDAGKGISAAMLDQSIDALYGYSRGLPCKPIAYTGALGFTQDLQIGEYCNGVILETVYVDRVLRSDERQRIEGYLAHKWSITDSLAIGHPFEDYAPDIVVDAGLIANFNNEYGSPEYTAETGQVATFVGNAQLDTAQKKFGISSLQLDGTGDYVTFPDSPDWHFGAGDFTVEFWVRFDVDPGTGLISLIGHYDAGASDRSWLVRLNNNQLTLIYSTNGTATTIFTGAWNPAATTWYHVAVCRSGADCRAFVDGAVIFADNISTDSLHNSADTLWIGAVDFGAGVTEELDGHIDGVRIVKGTALYVRDFTPPHRSFRSPVVAGVLENFDGLDAEAGGSPEYVFESGQVATFFGDAQLDTAQKKFGISSLYMTNGSPASYVNIPDGSPLGDYNPGGGDFSLEFWARFEGDPGGAVTEYFVSNWDAAASDRSWAVALENNTLRWAWSTNGTAVSSITEAWDPVGDTWYHICVERFEGNLFFYVDGACIGTNPHSVTYHQSANGMDIGSLLQATGRLNANDFGGWIDGLRFQKGRSHYARIDAPEFPFNGTFDNSALLLNFDGADLQTTYTSDDAGAIDLTFIGGAQLSNTERRVGETSLDVLAEADAVEVPIGNGINPGTGDFTLELFCRFSTAPGGSYNAIIDQRLDGTPQDRIYLGTNTAGNWTWYTQTSDKISGGSPTTNTWYHVVVERVDGITRMYVDGIQIGSDYADSNNYLDGPLTIGSRWDQGATNNSFEGYIDMVRVSVGTAIYTGDFTLVDAPGEPII